VSQNKFENIQIGLKHVILQLHDYNFVTSSGDVPRFLPQYFKHVAAICLDPFDIFQNFGLSLNPV